MANFMEDINNINIIKKELSELPIRSKGKILFGKQYFPYN